MRDRWFALVVVLMLGAFVGLTRPAAEKAPRFIVGQTYSFAIDCGIRQSFERDKDGTPVVVDISDCYQEPLKVRRVLEDGWLEVVDIRDERPKPAVWMVNPDRVWGYAVIRNPHDQNAALDPVGGQTAQLCDPGWTGPHCVPYPTRGR